MNSRIIGVGGVRIAAMAACVPAERVDNLASCTELFHDAQKAAGVVATTGIAHRRVAAVGVSSLDLCAAAARRALDLSGTAADEIGAVLSVSFTPERAMPGNAAQAQARLGLAASVPAFDVGQACAGWAYGLLLAAQLARAAGCKVLLLDGDVQTAHLAPDDAATVPVLGDAGTATLVEPDAAAAPWQFGFLTDGAKGAALAMDCGGTLRMDGMAVFRFVSTDVLRFLRGFVAALPAERREIDAFVPHQANVFMIRQLAKGLGFADRLWTGCEEYGNCASASVPLALCHGIRAGRAPGRTLVAGFGGGLCASACRLDFAAAPVADVVEYREGADA